MDGAGHIKMLFDFQNARYRVYDRHIGISVAILRDESWIEIMYEPVAKHQGEDIFVLITSTLVLIISSHLSVSLMIQPKICPVKLNEVMKPLKPFTLLDSKGVGNYLVFLCRRDTCVQLIQASYRLTSSGDMAIQLADVLSLEGTLFRFEKRFGSDFLGLVVPFKQSQPEEVVLLPPPPPPPPQTKSRIRRMECITDNTLKNEPISPQKPPQMLQGPSELIYLVIDRAQTDNLIDSSLQVSFYTVKLTSTGMEIISESTHMHSTRICNCILLTENSILLFSQLAEEKSSSYKESQCLLYVLHQDMLIEYPAPFLNNHDLSLPLFFSAGNIHLCPRSDDCSVTTIDFTEQLLEMQVRDSSIKNVYTGLNNRRLKLLAAPSQQAKFESATFQGTSPSQLTPQPDSESSRLLLSPVDSPIQEQAHIQDDLMLRPYLSVPPEPEIDITDSGITRTCAKAGHTLNKFTYQSIPTKFILQQLISRYVHWQDEAYDDHNTVLLDDVVAEVHSLSQHTKTILGRRQALIQTLQTGIDNPYTALHNFMLSIAHDVYSWIQEDMFLATIKVISSNELPERRAILNEYRTRRRKADSSEESIEICELWLQLATFFILQRWSSRIQRMLLAVTHRIVTTKLSELERRDPDLLSSIHFVSNILNTFESDESRYTNTKLTILAVDQEDMLCYSESDNDSESNDSEPLLGVSITEISYMQLFAYLTLLLALFGATIVAEERCYSVQGDQIKTRRKLDHEATYNLVFPAYALVEDNQLFIEATWIQFIKGTSFSLPAL